MRSQIPSSWGFTGLPEGDTMTKRVSATHAMKRKVIDDLPLLWHGSFPQHVN